VNMKNIIFISLVFSSVLINQNFSNFYSGNLSFTYSGTMSGEFNAGFVSPDSLSTEVSGAAAFINVDSLSNRIFIPAFQPSLTMENAIDLFILYMTDDGDDIDPQDWDVDVPDLNDLTTSCFSYREL